MSVFQGCLFTTWGAHTRPRPRQQDPMWASRCSGCTPRGAAWRTGAPWTPSRRGDPRVPASTAATASSSSAPAGR